MAPYFPDYPGINQPPKPLTAEQFHFLMDALVITELLFDPHVLEGLNIHEETRYYYQGRFCSAGI